MNQYIINDGELLETKMLLEDMLDGEDHIDRLLEIVNTVCSHPYNPQEQRDKVLEELETENSARITELKGWIRICQNEKNRCNTLVVLLGERQYLSVKYADLHKGEP